MRTNEENFYVERQDDGKYAARRGSAKRVSFLADTQEQAAKRAHESDPSAIVYVERVRHTDVGGPDRWRVVYEGKRD